MTAAATLTLTPTPAPLTTAINQAAAKAAPGTGIPQGLFASLLAGIWRFESRSTYPNPAVNGSGFGGLFGTTNAFASTQAQADTAAGILAAGLKKANGNIPEALSYYNTGSTTVNPSYVSSVTHDTTPPSSGGGSTVVGLENDAANLVNNPLGTIGGIISGVPSAVKNAATGAVGGVTSDVAGAIEGPIVDFAKGTAATGLAYVLLTVVGLAFVVLGTLEFFGYSPKRIAGNVTGAVTRGASSGEIPF